MTELNIDHLRQWIGNEKASAEYVSAGLVERFAATFDLQLDTQDGADSPAFIHWCLGQPAEPSHSLGADGHPERGGFLPPVPLPRRMWAGGEVIFHDSLRIGETMTRLSTISDVTTKTGRSGPLVFVTIKHDVSSDGRHVLSERQNIVFRGAGVSVTTKDGIPVVKPAPEGKHVATVKSAAPLLFRYSALTFNAHRIHYDAPYTRGVEGYPGLVVQGPLQATMLQQFAEKLQGAKPLQFRFRSLSPIFDTADFTLNATEEMDGTLKLWTAQIGGPAAMEAIAQW